MSDGPYDPVLNKVWVAVAVVVGALVLVLLVGGIRPAWSHDFWINNKGYTNRTGIHCCGENDCQSLREGDVKRVEGGYFIDTLNEFVPDADAQVGEDGFYWRCHQTLDKTQRRCFFTPTGGT